MDRIDDLDIGTSGQQTKGLADLLEAVAETFPAVSSNRISLRSPSSFPTPRSSASDPRTAALFQAASITVLPVTSMIPASIPSASKLRRDVSVGANASPRRPTPDAGSPLPGAVPKTTST